MKNSPREFEVQMFWQISTDAHRARSAREAQLALGELEVMAMHTENAALRDRCVAALDRKQVAA